MKVVNNRNKLVRFDALGEGIVFIADGVNVCMKIESTYSDDSGYYENAVYLEDGKLDYFKDDHMVCPVVCELTIE